MLIWQVWVYLFGLQIWGGKAAWGRYRNMKIDANEGYLRVMLEESCVV